MNINEIVMRLESTSFLRKKKRLRFQKKKNRARKAIHKGMATAAASICGCTKDRECAYHYAKSLKEEFGMTHDNGFSFDRLYSEVNYAPL